MTTPNQQRFKRDLVSVRTVQRELEGLRQDVATIGGALLAVGQDLIAAHERSRTPQEWEDLVYGATPAAGQGFTYTASGAALVPLSIMCRLTCSAVAGDRSLTIEYQDGNGSRYMVAGANTTLAASQSQSFCWQPTSGVGSWPVDDVAVAPLPDQLIPRGFKIVLRLVGADAADQLDQIRIRGHFTTRTTTRPS